MEHEREGRARWVPGLLLAAVLVLLLDVAFGLLPTDPVFWVFTPVRLLVLAGLTLVLVATRSPGVFRTPLDLPVLLLLGAAGGTTVLTGVGWPGFRALLTVVGAGYLMVAARRLARPAPGGADAVASLALVVVAAAGAVAVAQVAAGVPTGFCRADLLHDAPCSAPGAVTRATGTFANPNLLAAVIVLLGPLGAVVVVRGRELQERLVAGVLLVVAYVGLIMTFSRAGYAAALIGGLVLLGGTLARRPDAVRLRAALIGTAVTGLVAGALLVYRNGGSLGVRQDVWAAAVDVGLAHPLGVGLGRAGDVLGATTASGVAVVHAHNLWLNYFAELGWGGLLAMGVLTLAAVLVAARAVGRGRVTGAALLAGLVGFLLMSVADHPANLSRIALALWLVLGLVAVEGSTVHTEGGRRRGRHVAGSADEQPEPGDDARPAAAPARGSRAGSPVRGARAATPPPAPVPVGVQRA